MQKFITLGLAISTVAIAIALFFQTTAEVAPESTDSHTTETISIPKPAEATPIQSPALPREERITVVTPTAQPKSRDHVHDHSDNGVCAGCTQGASQYARITDAEILTSWQAADTIAFQERFPEHPKGTDLVQRAMPYHVYDGLDEKKQEDLVAYAERAVDHDFARLPQLCWKEGTDKSVIEAYNLARSQAIEDDGLQRVFQGDDRWVTTATNSSNPSGSGVTLTWGIVPDGTVISRDLDAPAPSNLIARLDAAYGASSTGDIQDAPWFELFEKAFQEWSDITGNVYIYEPNDDGGNFPFAAGQLGVRPDVRIAGARIDGNNGTLAFNYFPDLGDMVIDSDDDSNFTNNAGGRQFFINVLAHEHGHGLGLSHVCPVNRTKLMEPFATSSFEGAQFDELVTAQGLYGDPFERQGNLRNNNSPANAYQLNTLSGPQTLENLSISNNSDVDVFKFQVSSGSTLNVEVIPTSRAAYAEGSQNSDGSCSAGTLYDPRNRQNLSIRILDSDGNTVLASASSAPIGQTEIIENVVIPGTNTDYFIEINGGDENSNSDNNAQVYSLVITPRNAELLEVTNFAIVSESCVPNNDAIDPNETVRVELTVTNVGANTINSPVVTLQQASNLTIIGGAQKNLTSLNVGQSTTVTFDLILTGDCGSDQSLVFDLATDDGTSTHTERFKLGLINSLLDFDFESSTSLPSGLTQSSNTSAAWRVTTSNVIEGMRSVQADGFGNFDSVILTTDSFTPTDNIKELQFDHVYDLENTYDGGILEIQIDGGDWTEWTAAQGTFPENGYTQTIDSGFGSAIAGQRAWSGSSGGAQTVMATFPDEALGKSVRIRWRFASDSSVSSNFWRIDNILLSGYTCCSSSNAPTPVLSITTSDSIAQEFNTADTATFTIASDISPSSKLNIPYTVSGEATPGTDYIALAGMATINAGSQQTSITITAIEDLISEGNETVTVTLTASPNYTIAPESGSATAAIFDLPFDRWRRETFSPGATETGDIQDFDNDGLKNLVEYALGTDPTRLTPPIKAELSEDETRVELVFSQNTTLADIQYIVETTTDLTDDSWTTTGVTLTNGPINGDGVREVTASVDLLERQRFLRLRIERLTAQP